MVGDSCLRSESMVSSWLSCLSQLESLTWILIFGGLVLSSNG